MADENELSETTETADSGETTETIESAPLAPADLPRMTGEKAVDIALGAALLAAEAASRAVQQISEQAEKVRENAPAILQSMEDKGRPLRESLVSKLQGGTFAPQGQTVSAPPENAEDEITALEQRVRELEYQVSAPPPAPAETSIRDFDTEVFGTEPAAETPAEAATFEPFPASEALADSAYAVSETEDEARAEGAETPSETALPADAMDMSEEAGEEKAKGRKKSA